MRMPRHQLADRVDADAAPAASHGVNGCHRGGGGGPAATFADGGTSHGPL